MPSVLKLMQKGFPSRTSFSDLYDMYKEILPPKLKRLDPRLFCKCLFHALGLNDVDFKFGMTKVFFRPGKFAEFDQLMRQDKEHMNALIAKVQSWLHRTRWKKAQYGTWSVIKLDRKIKYRAAALIKIHIQQNTNVQNAIQNCAKLEKELDSIVEHLKIQAVADQREKEKMKQLERQIAAEKERQIQELKEKQNQETKIRELREIEAKRQQEEVLRQQKIVEIEAQMAYEKAEEEKRFKKLEQERLDAELARRLAMEDGQTLDGLKTVQNNNNVARTGKQDLSSWTYAVLRDTINNSNNIELLLACRQELASRLHQYHQWRSRNMPEAASSSHRAPESVLNAAPVLHPEVSSRNAPAPIQRYFRVPFSAPSASDQSGQNTHLRNSAVGGIWLAHFDGQFVARQMEIHPNKPPVLLVAGKDDDLMCELTLDQTQLTRKKGVEILPDEFEALWHKFHGPFYCPDPGVTKIVESFSILFDFRSPQFWLLLHAGSLLFLSGFIYLTILVCDRLTKISPPPLLPIIKFDTKGFSANELRLFNVKNVTTGLQLHLVPRFDNGNLRTPALEGTTPKGPVFLDPIVKPLLESEPAATELVFVRWDMCIDVQNTPEDAAAGEIATSTVVNTSEEKRSISEKSKKEQISRDVVSKPSRENEIPASAVVPETTTTTPITPEVVSLQTNKDYPSRISNQLVREKSSAKNSTKI
uniref:Myosin motor domain-containing protein n=1 Tax=Panagrolaimus sp. JU765 TaxID=591449 RepID=A0AC34R988_9BILA